MVSSWLESLKHKKREVGEMLLSTTNEQSLTYELWGPLQQSRTTKWRDLNYFSGMISLGEVVQNDMDAYMDWQRHLTL